MAKIEEIELADLHEWLDKQTRVDLSRGTPIGSEHLTAYLDRRRTGWNNQNAFAQVLVDAKSDGIIDQNEAFGRFTRGYRVVRGIHARKTGRARMTKLKADCAVAQTAIDCLAQRHARGATLFNAYKSAMWCWDNARRAFRNERPAEYQKGLFISKTNSAIEFRRRDRQMRKFSRGVDEAFGVDYSSRGPYCIICGFNSGSHDRRCPQPNREPWDGKVSGF